MMRREKRHETKAKYKGKNRMKQNPYMNGREKRRETKPFGRKKKGKKKRKKKTSGHVKVNC